MNTRDIAHEYEMRGRESAYRSISADITRQYHDGQIELSEKRRLDAENHYRYINTPDADEERARNSKIKQFDFTKPLKGADIRTLEINAHQFACYGKHWLDRERKMRFLSIFGCVFYLKDDKWRFDHAEG